MERSAGFITGVDAMNVRLKQRRMFVVTVVFLCLFLLLSGYFFSVVSTNTYVGIRAEKAGGQWQVQKMEPDGLALPKGVKAGDRIVLVDDQPADRNAILNRWLVVEQVESITVAREGKERRIAVSDGFVGLDRFIVFFSVGLLGFLLLLRYAKKLVNSRSGVYFYSFIMLFSFGLLAVVPSSLGDSLGRLLVIAFISLFPAYILSFVSLTTRKNFKPSYRNKKYGFVLSIGLINILLCVYALFFKMPYSVSEYLAVGIFYWLGVMLAAIFIYDVFSRLRRREKEQSSKVNVSLITFLSFSPLFLFYIFPQKQIVPFPLILLFTVLPVSGIVHLLILSRFVSYRYKLSHHVLYLLLVIVVTLSLLKDYVPLYALLLYGFILLYSFLPLIEEVVLATRRRKDQSNAAALFSAVEDERESISLFIHDTVIQDVIYSMKRIEENQEKLSRKEMLQTLDEVVFYLRELCSNIYPLMIHETGLKSALFSMINQLERKHPVTITCSIEAGKLNFSPKKNNFILRSIKEFMTNSVVHGNASEIFLTVMEEQGVYSFEVKDNGRYVAQRNDDALHFGIGVIREKVALLNGDLKMDVQDQTTVTLEIPLGD